MVRGSLLRDVISIYDSNGNLITEGQKANIQQGSLIITLKGNFPVDIGYIIECKTPNGVLEKYKVLEPNYHQGLKSIGPHYQMKVVNVNALPDPRSSSTVNTIHATGNARVYQQSTDNSLNLYSNTDLKDALNQIKSDILDLDLEDSEQILTNKAIIKITEEVESGNPSKDKLSAYISMFPTAVATLESVLNLTNMAGLS